MGSPLNPDLQAVPSFDLEVIIAEERKKVFFTYITLCLTFSIAHEWVVARTRIRLVRSSFILIRSEMTLNAGGRRGAWFYRTISDEDGVQTYQHLCKMCKLYSRIQTEQMICISSPQKCTPTIFAAKTIITFHLLCPVLHYQV